MLQQVDTSWIGKLVVGDFSWADALALGLTAIVAFIGGSLIAYSKKRGEISAEIAESDRLIALRKREHVEKSQFDVEFRNYQELSGALLKVSVQLGNLDYYSRHEMRTDAGEGWKKAMARKEEFMSVLEPAIELYLSRKPYIYGGVQEKILHYFVSVDLLSTTLFENVKHEYVLNEPLMDKDTNDRIRREYDDIEAAIKERLAVLQSGK